MRPKMKNALLIAALLLLLSLSGCFAKPTNTLDECEAKNIPERDQCYFDNAIQKNELSFCTQIIDANVRNDCINSI
ncbi:MAG TPA: hypothetical protein VJG83_06815 [archaeon]|nr:hypothetical protein [archaeon]